MELTEKPQSGHEYAETLLAAANKEQRGKLTVFLGAAAGVGKTCSMLQEAHAVCGRGLTLYSAWCLRTGAKRQQRFWKGCRVFPSRK